MRSSVQFENWSVPAYIGPKSIKYDEDNSYVLHMCCCVDGPILRVSA